VSVAAPEESTRRFRKGKITPIQSGLIIGVAGFFNLLLK
jgi:hypothetical protein